MGHKATHPIDWNLTPRSPAAVTCLNIVTLAHNFPGAPIGVVAGLSHAVQLVFSHPVAMQSKVQRRCQRVALGETHKRHLQENLGMLPLYKKLNFQFFTTFWAKQLWREAKIMAFPSWSVFTLKPHWDAKLGVRRKAELSEEGGERRGWLKKNKKGDKEKYNSEMSTYSWRLKLPEHSPRADRRPHAWCSPDILSWYLRVKMYVEKVAFSGVENLTAAIRKRLECLCLIVVVQNTTKLKALHLVGA